MADKYANHDHAQPGDMGGVFDRVALKLLITGLLELIIGFASGSGVVISDGSHNLSDGVINKLSGRVEWVQARWGYRHGLRHNLAEAINASVYIITMILVAIGLVEALRLHGRSSWLKIMVGVVSFGVNRWGARDHKRAAQATSNVKLAQRHRANQRELESDCLGSLAVVAAGLGALAYSWPWWDALFAGLVTVGVLAHCAPHAWSHIRQIHTQAGCDEPDLGG